MKKLFLSMGAIAGVAVSALTLASCGGNNEAVVTGADGKDVKIVVTDDATEVSKALLAVASSAASNKETYYSVGVDASLDASVKADYMGASFDLGANVTASVYGTIGKNNYTDYSAVEEPTEAQITAAKNAISSNVDLEAKANAEVTLNATFSDEMKSQMGEAATQYEAAFKNQKLTASAAAFTEDNLTMYTEANLECTQGIYDFVTMMSGKELIPGAEAEDGKYKVDMYYNLGEANIKDEDALQINSLLAAYQTNDLNAVLTMLGVDTSVIAPTTATTTVNVYESDEFKALVAGVQMLGVKVSEVKNGDVTFSLDAKGSLLNTAMSIINSKQIVPHGDIAITTAMFNGVTTTTTGIFDENTVYASASLKIGAATGLPKNITIGTDNIKGIVNAYLGASTSESAEIVKSGSINLSLDFKYNDDVKFTKTKTAGKTYVALFENELK